MNKEQIIEEFFPEPFDVILELEDPRKYEIRQQAKPADYLEMTGLTDEHITHLIKIMGLWLGWVMSYGAQMTML